MTMEWKKCHINVPLNDKGITEHESFNNDMPNIVSYTLTADEYYLLERVFDKWNRRFNLLIDIFEEEVLEPQYCREALEILEECVAQVGESRFSVSAEILRKALETALKAKTPLYLDF